MSKNITQTNSTKNPTLTTLLTLFFGWSGLHLFYLGRWGKGILYLVTLGFFGYGWLYDFIKAIGGKLYDGKGLPVTNRVVHYSIS